jgi:hypothetical protein
MYDEMMSPPPDRVGVIISTCYQEAVERMCLILLSKGGQAGITAYST